MRNILIIAMLLVSSLAHSQSGEDLDLSITISDFVGTWKYENAQTNEIFIIKIAEPVKFYSNYRKEYSNCILGAYYYSKDNIVISDNLDTINKSIPNIISGELLNQCPIVCFIYGDEQNNLSLVFTDQSAYARSADTKLRVARIRGGGYKMYWKIERYDVLMLSFLHALDENEPAPEPFTVPTNVELIKVLEESNN